MANNIIDKIQVSGVTYDIQGSGSIIVDPSFDSGSTNPVQNKVIYNKIDEVEQVTAAALNELNDKITPTVELTQAQYDALVSAGTVSADTYYIITDATAFDPSTKVDTSAFTAYSAATNTALNNKVDKSAVVSSVTSASTDSQIPTAKAVWEVASGGTTYTAGRGISIANDTISFSLPISAGTGTGSIVFSNGKTNGKCSLAIGDNSKNSSLASEANGQTSFSCGLKTIANKDYSAAFGDRITTKNKDEFGCGSFNNSVSASTSFGDSGNTLFSVGNGTANNARHNAFEIRQNGDIYLSLNGQDVKLQDQLGGSSITVDTELDSGSTNPVENRVIYNKIDEVEQVTAAGLNAVNDALGGLKLVSLSQAEYNALATKDSSTLYIIVN